MNRSTFAGGGLSAVLLLMLMMMVAAGCGRQVPPDQPAEPPAPTAQEKPPAADLPRAAHVGTETCRQCHPTQAEPFPLTAHSRALRTVALDREPPDGEFQHAASGRSYRVYRRDGELRHREWIGDEAGEAVVADYPVKNCVGSGRHSQTYLAEIDGFLVESPITWYASRQAWDVSPGYNVPHPESFERAMDAGCLNCHVSRAEAIDNSYHRMRFAELGIGCERCHGSGAGHVAKHQPGAAADPSPDPIVHPGKLSRDLSEAICAQCHLRGDATVFLPGESMDSFQPGRPLTSNRIDYRAAASDNAMTVVGHMEQMWLSRCYTQSETLTCITCHDVHSDHPSDGARVRAASRARCDECHAPAACGLPLESPARTNVRNDCLACHMPQTETDIPHLAFTHHRIAVHGESSESAAAAPRGELAAITNVDGLSASLRTRGLGLALVEFAARAPNPAARQKLHARALALLGDIARRGEADGEVAGVLARLVWEQSPGQSIGLAEQAIRSEDIAAGTRANTYLVLADALLSENRATEALRWTEPLTRARRHSGDWLLTAACRAAGDPAGEMAALEKAVEIQPFREDLLGALAEACRRAGRTERLKSVERQRALILKSRLRPDQTRGGSRTGS